MAMPHLPAIYAIRHIASGRVYVGSAVNVNRRCVMHRHDLKTNKHHSNYLQSAWNKYGADAFVFEVLEPITDPADLLRREQHWMDCLQSGQKARGFNVCPVAGSRLGISIPPDAREKQRKAMILHCADPAVREAMRQRSLGRKMTPEAIEKGASKRRGRKLPDQHRAKLVAAHIGKPRAPAHRAAISAALKGRKLSHEWIANIAAGTKRHWETRCRTVGANGRANISAGLKTAYADGRRVTSIEIKAKISASVKAAYAKEPHPPRSAESRAKTSAALKGRPCPPERAAKISAAKKAAFAAHPEQRANLSAGQKAANAARRISFQPIPRSTKPLAKQYELDLSM